MDPGAKVEASAPDLEDKRKQILTEIDIISQHYQEFWKSRSAELQICSTIILKQTVLSARFTEFHNIWQEKAVGGVDPSTPHGQALEYVNAEVLQINEVLESCEQRIQNVHNILKDMIVAFRKRLADLQNAQAECLRATSLDQLRNFRAQEFTDPRAVCPDVNLLNREWEEFGLEAKLDQCLEKLRRI